MEWDMGFEVCMFSAARYQQWMGNEDMSHLEHLNKKLMHQKKRMRMYYECVGFVVVAIQQIQVSYWLCYSPYYQEKVHPDQP